MSITLASANTATSTGKTLPPELQKIVARVTEISSLPEITTRIVAVVEDPRATARDMHDIVRSDPALVAKILKVVNSAFYGLPAQIASLERAIVMLGLSAVKNLALAASLSRMFRADAVCDQFAARDLWRHCVAAGVAARLLANAVHLPQVDEAFVAGLVHDVGLIVAQQLFPAKLREVATACLSNPQDFCATEIAVIGADHQALGWALASRWKFPPGLRHAIAYHHEPWALQPELRRMAATVYVADTLICQAKLGFWLTASRQAVSDETLGLVELSRPALDEIVAALPGHVDEAEQIFADG
jgi:HD-like signal output (HDOD) protein